MNCNLSAIPVHVHNSFPSFFSDALLIIVVLLSCYMRSLLTHRYLYTLCSLVKNTQGKISNSSKHMQKHLFMGKNIYAYINVSLDR